MLSYEKHAAGIEERGAAPAKFEVDEVQPVSPEGPGLVFAHESNRPGGCIAEHHHMFGNLFKQLLRQVSLPLQLTLAPRWVKALRPRLTLAQGALHLSDDTEECPQSL